MMRMLWPSVLGGMESMIRTFSVRSSLPVCEIERTHVEAMGTRIRPYNPISGFVGAPPGSTPQALALSAWRLAHAVRKADCLQPSLSRSLISAIGFLLEHLPTFDWRQPNLRLQRGVARGFSDASGTSFAGRIGQGVALLTLESRGYAFAAHYRRTVNERGPDFIIEGSLHRALLESKGAFVAPGMSPDIKGTLREGLVQLTAVRPGNAMGATKSFVVGTFLRETGDPHVEPSLVALVDPELEEGAASDSSDWVIRENYAGWLRALGLWNVASDLSGRVARVTGERVSAKEWQISGSKFLLFPTALLASSPQSLPDHCLVLGLDRRIVEALRHTLAHPETTMSPLRSLESKPIQADGLYGSVMSDGSFMGTLPAHSIFGNGPLEEIEL